MENRVLFNLAIPHLLDMEGGYVNDPADPGGETKFGISKRRFPALDIKTLTLDEAVDIYWTHYWVKGSCHELPDPLAMFHFDGCVNHGIFTANRLLQRALGIADDGVVGPITLAAAANADCAFVLVKAFTARAFLYHELSPIGSSQSRFTKGWFKRLFSLQQFIFNEAPP